MPKTTKNSAAAANASTSTAAAAPKKAVAAKKAAVSPPPPAKAAAPDTVTHKHLSAALSDRHTLSKKQADTIMADLFGMVVEHFKAGERVRIGGLGIIYFKNRPARRARNPATGASIQIAASKKVVFRAAKESKEAV